ncbi:hypothetical protein KO488_12885 [Poseidonibacter lekithochrous]|uniref:hypothetical protein n=1 Tax=Poseidonibacter TaxID=2321187 RepID=UPI001C09E569|nr:MULTISPECIES: hypothetical protein [Poseidonibacter]MBU3015658.1 hypothetical protein [Poseidonibacter lekithochrous]MDO6828959.1 hypothetical protein [Poseidonibacter sp. 1_MG-2023]
MYKKYNIKYFKSEKQIIDLFNKISKNVLSDIADDEKRHSLENVIKQYLPEETIHFKSLKELFKKYNTSKKKMINDSILIGYPDIDEDLIPTLKQEFKILIKKKKIKINLESDTPIFNEIVSIMTYAKKVDSLLKEYPLKKSTYNGTKSASTSLKDMINTQLTALRDKLNNPYFKINDDFEIKKTEHQIRILEKCQDKRFKDLPEIINTANNLYGIDYKNDESTDLENASFRELTQLFNGTLTSELEILYSFAIFICETIGIYDKKFSIKQADAIANISYTLYRENIDSLNLENKRAVFTYTTDKIGKSYIQKTIIENTPIFVYEKKAEQINALDKMIEIGFKSLSGVRHDYNKDLPLESEISDIEQLKNLIRNLKEMNFIPREVFFLFSYYEYISNRLKPQHLLIKI